MKNNFKCQHLLERYIIQGYIERGQSLLKMSMAMAIFRLYWSPIEELYLKM